MQGPETLVALAARQTVEAVVPFEERVVWEQRCFQCHQLGGRDASRLLKTEVVVPMQRLDPICHPQTPPVDGVDRAPVHRCGTRAQRLVDAVTEANALDERQTLGE